MKSMTTRERLLASSMIFGVMAAAAATPALAQTTAPPPPPATGTTDQSNPIVIVTGSHIPQPNLTSVAPVATVANVQFKVEGVAHVEDLLNQLPQVVAAQGGMLSNGATGTAEVNLRNLGANRTLVLIDGRREMPGDPTEPTADLNFIPPALIDRVEIDTASASSIYGADAVAGVVNFIMKKDFQGAEIDFNAGVYGHDQHDGSIQDLIGAHGFREAPGSVWDGATFDVTGVIGVNSPDEKGNVTAYIGYTHANAITQATRDFSACSLSDGKHGFTCGGSATDATGSFFILDQNFNYNPPGIQTVTGTGAASHFRNFAATDEFNYAPYNFYQRPDER